MSAPPLARRRPPWIRWVRDNFAVALARLLRPARGGATPIWRAYARVALGTAVAIAGLLLVMRFIDVPAINAARQSPPWLAGFFQFVTQLGLAGWFLVPLGAALLAIALVTSPSMTRMSQLVLASLAVRLSFVFVAIALPGLVVTIVKRLIGRARPFVGGEPDAFLYKLFLWKVEYASFPSGHATNAFAAAIAIGALWPRLRPLLWTYAALIALSRIVVTAHHPSDVLAGAIAGAVGALLVRDWFAARGLGFAIRPDGSVAPLSGPSLKRFKRVARKLAGQ
jgi:undecaprenyl-diphosphatase